MTQVEKKYKKKGLVVNYSFSFVALLPTMETENSEVEDMSKNLEYGGEDKEWTWYSFFLV